MERGEPRAREDRLSEFKAAISQPPNSLLVFKRCVLRRIILVWGINNAFARTVIANAADNLTGFGFHALAFNLAAERAGHQAIKARDNIAINGGFSMRVSDAAIICKEQEPPARDLGHRAH